MAAPARPVVALAVISALEGLAFVAYAVFVLVEGLRLGATGPESVSNVPAIALQAGLFLIFGVGLGLVAWGWWQQRRWARAPFLLAMLISGLIGYDLAQSTGAVRTAGLVMAGVAVVGIVLSFAPGVGRAIDSPGIES